MELLVGLLEVTATSDTNTSESGPLDTIVKGITGLGGVAGLIVLLRSFRSTRLQDEQRSVDMEHRRLEIEQLRRNLQVSDPTGAAQQQVLATQLENRQSIVGIEGLVVRFVLFYLSVFLWNFLTNTLDASLSIVGGGLLSSFGFRLLDYVYIIGQAAIFVVLGIGLLRDIGRVYGSDFLRVRSVVGESAPPSDARDDRQPGPTDA